MSFYDSVLSPVFGSKPQVAEYKPIDYGKEQQAAIDANIAAFPDISKIGDLYQNYVLGQYEKAMPGFGNLLASGTQSTQAMLDAAAPLLKG